MTFLSILRIVALCGSLLVAFLALGMSAHLTSVIQILFGGTEFFVLLVLGTSCLSIVTLLIMLIVDQVRNGAFTSMVLFELIWLGILSIKWIVTGVNAANQFRLFSLDGCYEGVDIDYPGMGTVCQESLGVIAFSFINFLLLFGYWLTLLIVALIGANRGHTVWRSSVKRTNFLAPAGAKANMSPYSNQSDLANMSSYSNQSVPANMPPYSNQNVPMQQPQFGSPAGYAGNVYPSPVKQTGHPAYAEV